MESFHSRVTVNVPVFDKILELRRQIAGLLGYKTWCGLFFHPRSEELMKLSRADYKTEVKMIKTGKAIEEASFQMIRSPSNADYNFLSS